MKHLFLAFLLGLGLSAHAADPPPPFSVGFITTENLDPVGTCTAGGCVELTTQGFGAVTVQVTGTYTGALSAQVTTDGSTWVTMCSATCTDTFKRITTGVLTATIASGAQDIFSIQVAGAKRVRIAALGAVTGTATVTIQAVQTSLGSGTSSGGGGAVTVADGADSALGAQADAAAAADTSTASLIALLKRTNQNLTTVNTSINAANTQLPAALGPNTNANLLAVGNPAATGTQSNVAASATDTTCLASNTSRKGASVYNDSTASLYLLLSSATSSATVFTVKMEQDDYYEVPYNYTGVLKCIWSSATGSARVTSWE